MRYTSFNLNERNFGFERSLKHRSFRPWQTLGLCNDHICQYVKCLFRVRNKDTQNKIPLTFSPWLPCLFYDHDQWKIRMRFWQIRGRHRKNADLAFCMQNYFIIFRSYFLKQFDFVSFVYFRAFFPLLSCHKDFASVMWFIRMTLVVPSMQILNLT